MTRIKSISQKRAAQHPELLTQGSTIARSSTKPNARKSVKKRNPARQKKEFARCYGSKERVEFVKGLPCAACGIVGYSENAHLLGNDGIGRKAGYETIGPLCGARPLFIGCHEQYDEYHGYFASRFPRFNPEAVAAQTEKAWRNSAQGQATLAGATVSDSVRSEDR